MIDVSEAAFFHFLDWATRYFSFQVPLTVVSSEPSSHSQSEKPGA